jgi:diacylglycerol kinase
MTFMKRFLKSVTYAINGLLSALKTERNLRIDIAAMLIAIAFGFYLKLSIITWGLITLVIGFVLVAELFNTAIERLGDEAANGVQKQLIKRAKDIAAAGELLSALTALILGILFLVIPFIHSFR